MSISMDFTFIDVTHSTHETLSRTFKHGFPNFQARISDRQARPEY